MKNQALFSSKHKSQKLKCRLLQFLFGTLRVKAFSLSMVSLTFVSKRPLTVPKRLSSFVSKRPLTVPKRLSSYIMLVKQKLSTYYILLKILSICYIICSRKNNIKVIKSLLKHVFCHLFLLKIFLLLLNEQENALSALQTEREKKKQFGLKL